MTSFLKIEDGTGVVDSNSYVSVSELNMYYLVRGVDLSEYDTTRREGSLIVASKYLDTTYNFKGSILKTEQAMSFPRTNIYDKEQRPKPFPQEIKDSVCELAYRFLKQGSLDKDINKGVESETINGSGVGSSSVKYLQGESNKTFVIVDKLVREYLAPQTSSITINYW